MVHLNRVARWCVFTILAVLSLGAAQGAVRTWDGGGGVDGTFSLDANWDSTAPANSITTDQAIFNGDFSLSPAQPTLTADRSINKITFSDTTTGGWNLGGAFKLTLGSGGISVGTTSANTASDTISSNVGIGAAQTWAVFGSSGVLNVDGIISGASNLRLTIGSTGATGPTGTVILTNNNIHAGGTTVGSGTLRVIDTTVNVGNTAVAKNGLGTGSVKIGNDDGNSVNNTPVLEVRVNGENNSTAQVLTYGNVLSMGVLSTGATATINVDRASGTGTNKIVAFGDLTFGRPSSVGILNVTGGNGYKLSVGTISMSPTTTDTGTFTLNPTTADMIVGGATSLGGTSRTPTLTLGGTSTGNEVTGAMIDRASTTISPMNLAKSNTSTWQIKGANTYTGSTTVSGGTLKLDTSATLGFGGTQILGKSAGNSSVTSAGTLDLNGSTALQEQITLSGTLTNSSATQAVIGDGMAVAAPTVGGAYSAVPTVVVTGGGGSGATATATLGVLTSNITIDSGGSGYTANPTVTVTGGSGYGASFSANRTGDVVTSLTMVSPGVGYLPGDVITISFTGGAGSGAAATVNTAELGVSGIQITSAGSGYTSAPALSYSGAGTGGGAASATMSGVTLSGTTSVINGTGDIKILGAVTGTGSFTKNDNNKLTLGGADTYTGKTTINAGTVLVNRTRIESANVTANGYNSATDGHYLVATGGTLGGTGRIAGFNNQANSNMVYVQSGGTIAPGASIGTLTLDGANISAGTARVLNMASGAEFDFELAGNGGTPDRIDFWNYATTDFVLNNNILNLSLSGAITPDTYTVDLFRFYSDAGSTAAASAIASGLTLTGATIDPNITGATIIYNTNTISLQYTVIPEPGTYALLVGGLGLLVFLRRRRKVA